MKVWNRREAGVPHTAVYVGRPTKWGNPFTHLGGTTLAQYKVSTREEAVAAFEQWFLQQESLVLEAKRELRNKDLVCWCAPQSCHAEVLMRVANEGV